MHIGFIEPHYLWALTALSVVVLLHLLKRPRTIKMPFSTLRFFNDAAIVSDRARRLKNILLFLIRMLIVLVLVLVFARPFFKNDPLRVLSNPDHNLYVWIDPTLSMSYKDEGVSLTERSTWFIDSLLALRSSGNSGVRFYNHRLEDFRVPADESFTAMKQRTVRFNYAAFSDACTRVVTADKRAVLLLVSDFQEATTEKIEARFSRAPLRKIPVIAVAVTPENPWNCSVRNARNGFSRETIITSEVAVSGNRTSVECALHATVNTIRTPSVRCSLGVDDDTLLTIVSSQRAANGWGTVGMDCDDPLSFDDSTWFISNRNDSLSVLVIGTRQETFPVIAALKATANEKITSLESVLPEVLSYETCSAADVVIINGFRTRSKAVQMLLSSQSERKQAFICIAGDDDSSTAAGISIPGYLGKTFRVKNRVDPLSVRLPDTLSELWRGFPALECREVRIRSYREGIQGVSLLKLANNASLAIEIDDARRRKWILFTTPLGITESNNLYRTGFYVPLLDRLVRYCIGELRAEDAPWVAGSRIRNPFYGKRYGAEIVDVQGTSVVRLHRQPFFTLEQPGVYKIVPSAAPVRFKMVVPDTAESRLVYRNPRRNGDYPVVRRPAELLAYLRNHGSAIEWVVPWLVLPLLLLCELTLRDNRQRKA